MPSTREWAIGYFYNADGEMLIVPEKGSLGDLYRAWCDRRFSQVDVAVLPRGLNFIEIATGRTAEAGDSTEPHVATSAKITASSFACPISGRSVQMAWQTRAILRRQSRGTRTATVRCEIVAKFGGNLWACETDHSPLDVVAWHGNYAPYLYDLTRFNTIGSISFDHPDPSIFTVLTSPSGETGVANCDFVIFPDRWLVAEDTFRPPWYHRNTMSEYMGLIYGQYDAKEEGFVPGGGSLHNQMSAHGPDLDAFEKASNAELKPQKLSGTMAFMFESRYIIRPTKFAMDCAELQHEYSEVWQGLKKNFNI